MASPKVSKKEKLTPEQARRMKHMALAKQNRAIRMTWLGKVVGGIQNVRTPLDTVCYPMIALHDDPKSLEWVVLFNLEFLEALIYKYGVPQSQIYYAFDSLDEAALALDMYDIPAGHLMQLTEAAVMGGAIDTLNEKFEMEFTAMALNKENAIIIGNPPYQENDGGGDGRGASPLYHKFIEQAIDSGVRYVSMVVPSRWMAGGRGLGSFRERMRTDRSVKTIRDFPGAKTVFPSVEIPGGVNYFLRDGSYTGDCDFNGHAIDLSSLDIIIRDHNTLGIIKHVKDMATVFVNSSVVSSKPFGLRTNYSGWVTTGVKCYAKGKVVQYVSAGAYTDKFNQIGLWKACIGNVDNLHREGSVYTRGTPFIAEPNSICTENFIIVASFDSQNEAENFLVYMKSRFFRFMLHVRVPGPTLCKEKFAFVPDLKDYTKAWTDSELYTMFNLSAEQIAHIEATIKEICLCP